MAKRNVSYQIQTQTDGSDRCVVIDKDTGTILAHASSEADLERFETDLVDARFPLDAVSLYAGFVRSHYRPKPQDTSGS